MILAKVLLNVPSRIRIQKSAEPLHGSTSQEPSFPVKAGSSGRLGTPVHLSFELHGLASHQRRQLFIRYDEAVNRLTDPKVPTPQVTISDHDTRVDWLSVLLLPSPVEFVLNRALDPDDLLAFDLVTRRSILVLEYSGNRLC